MEKTFYGEFVYIFGDSVGGAELILRIWGTKENTFRELRTFLSWIWGDQLIIFGDQGSTDPLWASLSGVSTQLQSFGLVAHENSTFRNLALAVSVPFMA